MLSVVRRMRWIHWALIVGYALLATGALFKITHELSQFTGWSGGFAQLYANSPKWMQIGMGIQTWAFAVVLGLSTAINGAPSLPFPALAFKHEGGDQ